MILEEIELAIVRYFKEQKHIIIPNFYLEHECDLIVIRPTRYAIEVEIKRTVADMKNDLKKSHNHVSEFIVELYYAFPENIAEKCIPLVPEHAGIFIIKPNRVKASLFRKAKRNPKAVRWTNREVKKVLRYSVYRVWGMKRKFVKLLKSKKS